MTQRATSVSALSFISNITLGLIVCAATYDALTDIHPSCSYCDFRLDRIVRVACFYASIILLLFWTISRRFWTMPAYVARVAIAGCIGFGLVAVALGSTGLLPTSVKVPIFLLGAGSTFVSLVIYGLTWLSTRSPSGERALALTIGLSTISMTLALTIWSMLVAALMVIQSQRLAEGHPYCIQVASDYLGRNKEVTHLYQLTGLRMWTPYTNAGGSGDYQFTFHATLFVWRPFIGSSAYNWSHRALRFVPVSDETLHATHIRRACNAEPSFAYRLRLSQ